MLIKDLMDNIPQKGLVEWIGVRPHKHAELLSINSCEVSIANGLKGDHYRGQSKKRQVTLVQSEHLSVVSSILNKEIEPAMLEEIL